MKIKKTDIVIIILMILSLAHILIVYPSLPDTIPTHWGISGQVDGYGSKSSLFFLWIMTAVLTPIMYVVPKIDPRKKNYERFEGPYKLFVLAFTVIMLLLVELVIASASSPVQLNVSKITCIGLGILFIVIGNYMPKFKQNYTCGIKTPWTLDNEEVWNKTHRFSGPLWMGCGAAVAVATLFLPTKIAMIVMFAAIMVMSLGSLIYSYVIYKKTVKK